MIKLTVILASCLLLSSPLMANNIIRTKAPIYFVDQSNSGGGETQDPEEGDEEAASGMRVLNAQAGVSGIHTISYGEVNFQAYVDMERDGGYWVLAYHWKNPTSQKPMMKELGVIGNALKTYSADQTRYPVIPSGQINPSTRGMIASGNAAWVSLYGPWQSFDLGQTTRPVDAQNPIKVKTTSGTVDMWLPQNGWTPTTFGESGFGLLTAPNNSGICGGQSIYGQQKICPGYSGSTVANHFDLSSEKFYFLKAR